MSDASAPVSAAAYDPSRPQFVVTAEDDLRWRVSLAVAARLVAAEGEPGTAIDLHYAARALYHSDVPLGDPAEDPELAALLGAGQTTGLDPGTRTSPSGDQAAE